MNMTRDGRIDFSMFVLRTILGALFVVTGAQKLFGMFGGIGFEGTVKMIEGLGFPYPYIVAGLWAGIEFTGGIFLVLGIMARWSSAAIVIVTLIRIWKVNIIYGSFIQSGGVEYNLLVIAACIPLILMGGGSWSVWDL